LSMVGWEDLSTLDDRCMIHLKAEYAYASRVAPSPPAEMTEYHDRLMRLFKSYFRLKRDLNNYDRVST
jgi:hypothetical protein